jgi:hypothetical protein
MQDLLDTNNDIQDILGRSYALPNDVDEDDLDAGMPSHPSYHFSHPRTSHANFIIPSQLSA